MPHALACYRCGASLAELSLPLSRLDECPACRAELHVCRMCTHYTPRLMRGCDEDDAPEVRKREAANFCDYFKPNPQAFDPANASAEAAARAELAKLFGENRGDGRPRDDAGSGSANDGGETAPDDSPSSADDRARRDAEGLFKR